LITAVFLKDRLRLREEPSNKKDKILKLKISFMSDLKNMKVTLISFSGRLMNLNSGEILQQPEHDFSSD
jgi:hypothetical protein